jgi:hypothetical protein
MENFREGLHAFLRKSRESLVKYFFVGGDMFQQKLYTKPKHILNLLCFIHKAHVFDIIKQKGNYVYTYISRLV